MNVNTATPIDQRPDVHVWFGLSYSNYLVLHRTLLQSMPEEWQRNFVTMLDELHQAFVHVEQSECFKVEPAVEREVGDLSDEELKRIGYSKSDDCDCYATWEPGGETVHVPPVCPHEVTYYDDHASEVPYDHIVMWPMDRDPVPHYNRGRTRVEPCLPE